MVREDDKVREAEEEVREAGDVYPLSPPPPPPPSLQLFYLL